MSAPLIFTDAAAAVAALKPDLPLHGLRPHVWRAQAETLCTAFHGRVLYAVKCNPDPLALQAFWDGGVRDFDVASAPEAKRVREQFPDAGIHYMHPVKPRASIRAAAALGVRSFSIDMPEELDKLVFELGSVARCTLLVRLAVSNDAARWALSGKFGAAPAEAAAMLRRAQTLGARVGLAFHVGSLCLAPDAWARALGVAADTAFMANIALDVIDVGGGFPVAYEGLVVPPLKAFMAAIQDGVAQVPLAADGELWCEAGRVLAAPGGSLVVRVIGRRGQKLYINDGIFGGLHAPGPPPPHHGLPLRPLRPLRGAPVAFEVFGPTCDGSDRLGGAFVLPEDIAEGDWFEVGQHGAYGACLRSDFNGMQASLRAILRDGPLLSTPGFAPGPTDCQEVPGA